MHFHVPYCLLPTISAMFSPGAGFGQQVLNRDQEFAPLLFSLTPADAANATPRSVATPQPQSSLTSQRGTRSMMVSTPGSVQTEATPQAPPPPVMRLMDDVQMDEPSTSARAGGSTTPPFHSQLGFGAHAAPTPPLSGLGGHYEAPQTQYEDVWVTIYGFSQTDIPLILKEFAKCGDILQWGTFGQPQANFIHVQFQNKYAAQRALLRNGEALHPDLIIGVKPLDSRHRAAIEGYDSASGLEVFRPRAAPERPYRVEHTAAGGQIPQPSRSVMSKFSEFIFGL